MKSKVESILFVVWSVVMFFVGLALVGVYYAGQFYETIKERRL